MAPDQEEQLLDTARLAASQEILPRLGIERYDLAGLDPRVVEAWELLTLLVVSVGVGRRYDPDINTRTLGYAAAKRAKIAADTAEMRLLMTGRAA